MAATLLALCLVVGVLDGDTLTARCPTQDAAHPYQQLRVRFAGTDAPESGQAFGQKAKQALSDLTYKKTVQLECAKQDRHGRSVCNVYLSGGAPLDVGEAMIAQGWAWFYRDYARELSGAQRSAYDAAERQAQAQRRGLWADAQPTPPWQWRRADKSAAADVNGCMTGPKGGRYTLDANGRKHYGC